MNHIIQNISKVAHEYAVERYAQLDLERAISGKKGYDSIPRVKEIFTEKIVDIVLSQCFEEIEKHPQSNEIKQNIMKRFNKES